MGGRARTEHRWLVQYGSRALGQKRYVLLDKRSGAVLAEDDSKSAVIAESQRRHGFRVIDGSELTYGRQLAARGWR